MLLSASNYIHSPLPLTPAQFAPCRAHTLRSMFRRPQVPAGVGRIVDRSLESGWLNLLVGVAAVGVGVALQGLAGDRTTEWRGWMGCRRAKSATRPSLLLWRSSHSPPQPLARPRSGDYSLGTTKRDKVPRHPPSACQCWTRSPALPPGTYPRTPPTKLLNLLHLFICFLPFHPDVLLPQYHLT